MFAAPFYFWNTRRGGFWKSLLKSGVMLLLICLIAGVGFVAAEAITGVKHAR